MFRADLLLPGGDLAVPIVLSESDQETEALLSVGDAAEAEEGNPSIADCHRDEAHLREDCLLASSLLAETIAGMTGETIDELTTEESTTEEMTEEMTVWSAQGRRHHVVNLISGQF